MSLDLYTRQCSMGITAEQLSICGATIANEGLNPNTNKQVFDKALSPKITSMIATVGFYQHTGDWLYTSGIPAKTGVGGGVMGVMPGVMGIAACHQIYYEQTGHERIQWPSHPRAIIHFVPIGKPVFLSLREEYRLFN